MIEIACLTVELFCRESRSLKAKRQILKSMKDRLHARHNVSIAEVGFQDDRKRSRLAIALVSGDGKYLRGAVEAVREILPSLALGASIGYVEVEYFQAEESAEDYY